MLRIYLNDHQVRIYCNDFVITCTLAEWSFALANPCKLIDLVGNIDDRA